MVPPASKLPAEIAQLCGNGMCRGMCIFYPNTRTKITITPAIPRAIAAIPMIPSICVLLEYQQECGDDPDNAKQAWQVRGCINDKRDKHAQDSYVR
jgi:hypothetical protein